VRKPGLHTCIVFGELIRAIQSESEIAVAHHWGVTPATVSLWRRALGVPRMTDGSRKLAVALAPERLTDEARELAKQVMGRQDAREKIGALRRGKPLHPNMVAAQREAVKKPKSGEWRRGQAARMRKLWEHPENHGLPPCHRWTDQELTLLGTESDPVIAERLGVPPYIVENKRRQLGIASTRDVWRPEEIALVGTAKDQEVAARLGRTTAAVRRKRLQLGIAPFVARWSRDEIALLGTDTDLAVAEKLGRTLVAVQTQRWTLRIPAFEAAKSETET
jgi:hypothetical protein